MRALKKMFIAIVAVSAALAAGSRLGADAPGVSHQPRRPRRRLRPPHRRPRHRPLRPSRSRRSRSRRARRSPTSNINVIAANSVEGKAATGKIQDYIKKKNAEIQDKQKALADARRQSCSRAVTVMSDQARGQLEKDITKQTRELQSAQEDAQRSSRR